MNIDEPAEFIADANVAVLCVAEQLNRRIADDIRQPSDRCQNIRAVNQPPVLCHSQRVRIGHQPLQAGLVACSAAALRFHFQSASASVSFWALPYQPAPLLLSLRSFR